MSGVCGMFQICTIEGFLASTVRLRRKPSVA